MDERITRYLSREAGLDAAISIDETSPEGVPLYAAWLVDFPGCIAQGHSAEEATERLVALVPSFLTEMLALGVEIPEHESGMSIGFMRFEQQRPWGALAESENGRKENLRPHVSGSPEADFQFT